MAHSAPNMFEVNPLGQLALPDDDLKPRIEALAHASRQIIAGAQQENGALVAADPLHPDRAATSVDYNYMWLRDAAENLQAAYIASLPEAPEIRTGLVRWINDVMPPETDDKYGPKTAGKRQLVDTGEHDTRYYNPAQYNPPEWQPDNNALMVNALLGTADGAIDQQSFRAIASLCDGLVAHWDADSHSFTGNIENQWENHIVQGRHFTHTTLAAAHALSQAGNINMKDVPYRERDRLQRWSMVGNALYRAFETETPYPDEEQYAVYHRLLRQTNNREADGYNPLDAGVTLVLPQLLRPGSGLTIQRRAIRTVHEIGTLLLTDSNNVAMGTYRYHGDTYDGIDHPDGPEHGAGSWPLLLFSNSEALQHLGEQHLAHAVFLGGVATLDRLYKDKALPENVIPEQIFRDGDERQGQGVQPLVWSHSRFLRSAVKLGYL